MEDGAPLPLALGVASKGAVEPAHLLGQAVVVDCQLVLETDEVGQELLLVGEIPLQDGDHEVTRPGLHPSLHARSRAGGGDRGWGGVELTVGVQVAPLLVVDQRLEVRRLADLTFDVEDFVGGNLPPDLFDQRSTADTKLSQGSTSSRPGGRTNSLRRGSRL